MSERIAYQFNGDHVLKFAGMQKLTGEQVADELNRLYTIIAEKNEQIAEPERKVEPVAAPAGYFCEPYLNKPGLFEQVFNGFDDPDVIPLYRDPNGRIAALEREVEELRGYIAAAANRAGLAWHQGNTDSAVFWRAVLVGIERDLRKALAGGEANSGQS